MHAYKEGLLPHLPSMQTTINRVILKEVHQKISEVIVSQDHSTLICYEVIGVGPDVRKLAVGDHCLHISAAGDKTVGGITIVREEDVVLYWPEPKQ